MLREMRMQLRNLLLRQRRDGESRRSARLDGACRPDRSAGFCGAARPHGPHGSHGRNGCHRGYGRKHNGPYGSDGRDRRNRRNGHYRPHGRNRAGNIRETKTAIRKSKKVAEHEILPLFCTLYGFYVTQLPHHI